MKILFRRENGKLDARINDEDVLDKVAGFVVTAGPLGTVCEVTYFVFENGKPILDPVRQQAVVYSRSYLNPEITLIDDGKKFQAKEN